MVAPDAVIGDVHTPLAPTLGGGQGAISINERFVEKNVGLLLPDPEASFVEGVHEPLDIGGAEAAAEVPGGGGVGDASGPEGVEVDLIVATHFEVLDAAASGEEVVGDGEDVVALEVGLMTLEEMEVVVEVFHQMEFLCHEVDGSDASGGDGSGAVGHFIVDVGSGHHGLMTFDTRLVYDAASDSLLACGELAVDSGVHSKTSWRRMIEGVKYLDYPLKPGGFRVSATQKAWGDAWLRVRRIKHSLPNRMHGLTSMLEPIRNLAERFHSRSKPE